MRIFPYSAFGRCALGAVYFGNKRRQRERGLIRTDASVLRQPNGAEREVVALFESFRSAHGMIRSIDGRMSRARISVTMFRQKDDRVLLFKRHLCAVLHFNFDNTCKLYIFTFWTILLILSEN